MARKVLISFLGTGDYTPVFYSWNGKKTTDRPTKFIQEAIAAKLCKGWTEKDCIMVFRTEDSNVKNWLDSKSKEGLYVKGLDATLKGMSGLKPRVNPEKVASDDTYMIPAGFSEQETEDIFKIVFDKLEKDDEIYFDMTHAFRSIPIFASALFNYARFLKNTNVKGIYYGAFEALGPGYEVKKWAEDKIEANPAPIVDMTNMVLLQDLTTAAASFRKSGNVSSFSDLLADRIEEGIDESVDQIINALDDLDLYVQTSCIKKLKAGVYLKTINSSIDKFCSSDKTTDPQRKLLEEIQRMLTSYGFQAKDGYFNVEAAIKWAIDHKMIQQAYTMAKEYLISRVYDVFEENGLEDSLLKDVKKNKPRLKPKNQTYELRNAVGEILKSIYRKPNGGPYVMDKFNGVAEKYPTSNKLIELNQAIGSLSEAYIRISESRNKVNHGYMTSDDEVKRFHEFQEEFDEDWKICKKALKAISGE